MPSTHLSLHYHLIFSTKDREPWLSPTPRTRVHEYLGGVIRGLNGVPHTVGGTSDHVHVLAGLRATHCLADVPPPRFLPALGTITEGGQRS